MQGAFIVLQAQVSPDWRLAARFVVAPLLIHAWLPPIPLLPFPPTTDAQWEQLPKRNKCKNRESSSGFPLSE